MACGIGRCPTSWRSIRRRRTGTRTPKPMCTPNSIRPCVCQIGSSTWPAARLALASSRPIRPRKTRRATCRPSPSPSMDEATASRTFVDIFGEAPRARAQAPGRVNLIGEHTDYHQGFVLPVVLPQHTTVHVRPATDGRIRVVSLAMGGEVREYAIGTEAAVGTWVDYVQGVTWALGQHGFSTRGADLLIESTLPPGGGVSSSAALQVSLLRSFRAVLTLPFDDLTIARMAHEAETRFVGAAVGIMDQMACSVGRAGMAL